MTIKKKIIRGTEAKPTLVKYTESKGDMSFQIEFVKKDNNYTLSYKVTEPFIVSENNVDLKTSEFSEAEHQASRYLGGLLNGIAGVALHYSQTLQNKLS